MDDLVGERLDIALAEWNFRQSLIRGGTVAITHEANFEQWRQLASEVRDPVDIVPWIQQAGVQLTMGRREHYGPCPWCGGEDRFRVWSPDSDRNPGYWCRRCHRSGDVISVYRELIMPGSSFFQAVRVLAATVGLETPDFGADRKRRAGNTNRRVVVLTEGAPHAS